ncbi:MAG: hypothetical protein LBL79_03665 [Prevotella sp.]|jgi:hypothetical protein|nr:hypothetical protein [Prevotella sp.]
MNKRLLLTLLAFTIYTVVSAQELGTYQKLDIGINGIGMSLEVPVSEKIVIEPYIGVGPSYDLNGNGDALADKIDWHWALLEPSFHGAVYGKFLYNRSSRAEKGKSLLFNSGNFIGAKVKYISKSLSDPQFYSNTLLFNLNWGGQRNIGKHWAYSYSVGIGYGRNLDQSYGLFYPAFDIKITYVLPFFSKGSK